MNDVAIWLATGKIESSGLYIAPATYYAQARDYLGNEGLTKSRFIGKIGNC
jgi:hypothetical protein